MSKTLVHDRRADSATTIHFAASSDSYRTGSATCMSFFFFLFFRRKETKEAWCKQGREVMVILHKPNLFLCLDPDMHLSRTVFGPADAFGLMMTLYFIKTPPPELSVPKQGPLAAPTRVHVYFPAVFAHKFRVRQIKKSVSEHLENRWLS